MPDAVFQTAMKYIGRICGMWSHGFDLLITYYYTVLFPISKKKILNVTCGWKKYTGIEHWQGQHGKKGSVCHLFIISSSEVCRSLIFCKVENYQCLSICYEISVEDTHQSLFSLRLELPFSHIWSCIPLVSIYEVAYHYYPYNPLEI